MPQLGLFDLEEQLTALAPILIPESVPEPTEVEVTAVLEAIEEEVVEEGPKAPPYRETEWIREQAIGKPGSVTLVRIHRKHIAVVPLDLDAALMLHSYRTSEASLKVEKRKMANGQTQHVVLHDGSDSSYTNENAKPTLIRACLSKVESEKEFDKRVYFPFRNLFCEDPEQSFLAVHLRNCGFNVIIPPTVKKWIRKEWKREQLELTNYDLPEIKDKRPLFDQLEEGILLVCKQAFNEFEKDHRYVVMKLTDSNGSDNGVQLSLLTGQGEGAVLCSTKLTWYNSRAMEDYFEMEAGTEVVYDPDQSVVAKCKVEHERRMQILRNMNVDLYSHTVYDSAQASLHRNYICAKPQRMGKTSESIATALLWNSKKIGFVSPTKDTREEVKLELKRLGITDYVVVDSLKDFEKPGKFYLMDFWFVKGLWDDPESGSPKYDVQARCPHCNELLQRYEWEHVSDGWGKWVKHVDLGYRCLNDKCSYTETLPPNRKTSYGAYRGHPKGAAWYNPDKPSRFVNHTVPRLVKNADGVYVPDPNQEPRQGSGYVDLERARMARLYLQLKKNAKHEVKVDGPKLQLDGGRINTLTGYVNHAWSPPRVRRMKRACKTWIIDEGHILAHGSSAQSKAVMNLIGRHHILLTGTLMPNGPQDPYWPCHWTFRRGSAQFPFSGNGEKGLTKYKSLFCKNITLVSNDGKKRKKNLPIAVAPLKQRKLNAPLLIRRTFNDPFVRASLEEKGLFYPTVHFKTVFCDPDPHQAALMVDVMDKFKDAYQNYVSQQEEEGHQVNTAYILSSMNLLRVAATCPDFLNKKLKGILPEGQKIYHGVPGGGKTEKIREIVALKRARGEKVLILSFYTHELDILMQELSDFNPTLYDLRWSPAERFECRQRFLHDPSCTVLLGSIQALQVGVDLSSADTVICADLLWSPGRQDQAVARILKPVKLQRDCEVYYCLLNHSLDTHVYNVFYAKRVAAEQVLDGQITTPRPTNFDVKAFVDQVLSERAHMLKYALDIEIEHSSYIPVFGQAIDDDRE